MRRERGRKPKKKVCSFCVDKVEAIDYKDVAKIRRYTTEALKSRIVEGLEPRTKPPKDGDQKTVSKKQKARLKEKKSEKQDEKRKVKVRHRDSKNIGKRRKPSNLQANSESAVKSAKKAVE